MTALRCLSALSMVCVAAAVACGGKESRATDSRPDGGAAGASSGGSADAAGGEAGSGGSAIGGWSGAGGGGTGPGSGGSGGGVSAGGAGPSAGGSAAGGYPGSLVPDGGFPWDPLAEERAALIETFCSLSTQYPCLSVIGLAANGTGDCLLDNNVNAYTRPACWPEMSAYYECVNRYPFTCPCPGNDCYIDGHTPTGICPTELAAIDSCFSAVHTGTIGSCTWTQSADGRCEVLCKTDSVWNYFNAACEGPPGGPYACDCELNRMRVVDDSELVKTWSFQPDCPSVATWMDSGQCQSVLDCCFSWYGAPQPDMAPGDLCSCISDPTAIGFDSCGAAAASVGGAVVDLCPRYVYAGFPPSP